jgi:hypothetical protein
MKVEEEKFKESSCHNVHRDNSSSDDEPKEVYAVELVWTVNVKLPTCSSLQLVQENRQGEIKFTFNVAKCDKIFVKYLKLATLNFLTQFL